MAGMLFCMYKCFFSIVAFGYFFKGLTSVFKLFFPEFWDEMSALSGEMFEGLTLDYLYLASLLLGIRLVTENCCDLVLYPIDEDGSCKNTVYWVPRPSLAEGGTVCNPCPFKLCPLVVELRRMPTGTKLALLSYYGNYKEFFRRFVVASVVS